MKIEIEKAKVFEIDPTKDYMVHYNSDNYLTIENAKEIEKELLAAFTRVGAKVTTIVTHQAQIVINEVKK